MQVFDSRAFALGGAHSSRFIPAAAANAGVRPPLPRAPGGRPVAPNVGVPLPPELAAPAQAPATQANGFATQACSALSMWPACLDVTGAERRPGL